MTRRLAPAWRPGRSAGLRRRRAALHSRGAQTAGWPRCGNGETRRGKESPGSTETRCRLTAGGGDPRESATESRPPAAAWPPARVKGCGKSAPRLRRRSRHGKPHREQDRIGAACGMQIPQASFRAAARVGRVRRRVTGVPDEWPLLARLRARQNPAYRPSGTFSLTTSRKEH